MKKCIGILMVLLLSRCVLAAEFSPTLLKLSADPIIAYDFDGSPLDLPFEVSGTPASVVFCLFTMNMSDIIPNIVNGYLGWHQVNKIDTCIYYSPPLDFEPGIQVITWDGRDQDGGIVPVGDYTYYLWGYDNKSDKTPMSTLVYSGMLFDNRTSIQCLDTNGLPLAHPVWCSPQSYGESGNRTVYIETWEIGADPNDSENLLQSLPVFSPGWFLRGDCAFDPHDFDLLYCTVGNSDSGLLSIQKHRFVPGGNTEIVTDWGAEAPFAAMIQHAGDSAGVIADENYLYMTDNHNINSHYEDEMNARFIIYTLDGSLVDTVDMSPWWSSEYDFEHGGQMNGAPSLMFGRDGYLFLSGNFSCIHQMIDPYRYLTTKNVDDLIVWCNGNGDYTLDKNFEETAYLPWVCNDYHSSIYCYGTDADSNHFSSISAYYGGYGDKSEFSFGLIAPDGTGLGHYSCAVDNAGSNRGLKIIDSGTAYDGFYCDMNLIYRWKPASGVGQKEFGVGFLGHDSIKGVIQPISGNNVDDETPLSSSLSQNRPNPFNPVTSIPFSLGKESDVTIEVYNIAGEKITTLVDERLSAGNHSVIWNASEYASGVYFVRMEAGEFVEKRKMMLVK